MVKRVFSNTDQVIHIWVQQNQDTGRNGSGSISFEGGTLVSYSTPIARICEATGTGRPVKVALHTTTRYSVTTSQQQAGARQATNHLPSFNVAHLNSGIEYRGRAPRINNGTDWRDANMADYAERYEAALLRASRARTYGDRALQEAANLRDEAEKYALFFQCKFEAGMFPEPDSVGAQEIKARAKEALKAKSAATAEANKKKRKELGAIIDAICNGDDVMRLPYRWGSYASKEQVDKIMSYAGHIWRETGESIAGVSLREIPPLLRVHGDEIVTSWGARFPKIFAPKAFKQVQQCRNTKTVWETNGHKIPLGSFQIDRIDCEGNVKAGCHTVLWEAIAPVARHLGLMD